MNTHFIEKEITYDGSQLASHWILKNTGLYGDTVASFVGPCHVDLDHMVDLEDVLSKKIIHSESMLHFMVEFFDDDLERMVLRQRLLISTLQTELMDCFASERGNTNRVIRLGDDLFLEEYKLTVSIATKSPVSCLIHVGINISSLNTPVQTKGLQDFNLSPQAFARSVMNRFVEEMHGVKKARSKVRGVL